jgi:Rrf2 family protein
LFGFSEAHFAKVMQALSRAGIVRSVRGPAGGTRLARKPDEINLLEVYEALDGPIAENRCLLSPKICTTRCCPLGRELARMNQGLRQTLSGATLLAMSKATDWSGIIRTAGVSFSDLNGGFKKSKSKTTVTKE